MKIKPTTLEANMLNHIMAGVYITNGLLFYIAGLWTIRLFQPLKVFQ